MNLQSNKQAGFSMIEVLVAATILVVIVMMLGMLFQQTGIAWRVGVRRADAFSQVRSLLGSIQRDAAKAVDEDTIDDDVRNLLGGGSQNFSGGDLSFYTLDANGFNINSSGFTDENAPKRSVSHITYSISGIRTETFLIAGGSTETVDTNVRDFATRTGSTTTPTTTLGGFDPVWGSGGSGNGLPLYVKMKATVTSQGYTLDIGAESAGPDRTWNTDDDIRTWSDRN